MRYINDCPNEETPQEEPTLAEVLVVLEKLTTRIDQLESKLEWLLSKRFVKYVDN